MQMPNEEVGRELKVSELKPHTVVWLEKETWNVLTTMWVVEVSEAWVHFFAAAADVNFLATRTGPGREAITDDSGIPMKIYEYLGEG